MKNATRLKLNTEQIAQCHDLVDKLVKLYQETDPVLGEVSEVSKQEKALKALNHIGLISGILTEWAENQIFGSYYKIAKSEDNWIDAKACNMHENELMWYGDNIPEDAFSDDNHLACERLAIGKILHNTFSRYGRMGWRLSLKECLYALNEGQVEWLLEPIKTGQKGSGYDLSELKWVAIKHLFKLVGEGWKKEAAKQKIAEKCGVSIATIKKWEKECIAERDRDKKTIFSIKAGSKFIQEKLAEKYKEEEIFSRAVSKNLFTEDAVSQAISYGIISAIMLEREYPLDEMKTRFDEAGLRK